MMAPICTSLINAVTSCHLTGGTITKDDDSSLEDERTSVDEKRDGTTLEESNEPTFFLGIDATSDEGRIESEEQHYNHDTTRRRKQGVASYRLNQFRQSSLSIEFDMLTGLELYGNDNAEDEESDVDEEERRSATDDDQMLYILLGPPTIKRMKKFWIYTEWTASKKVMDAAAQLEADPGAMDVWEHEIIDDSDECF
eukprot:scaffold6597_cov100-Skeletonema_dohrnii-CCMP3373.AAC.1